MMDRGTAQLITELAAALRTYGRHRLVDDFRCPADPERIVGRGPCTCGFAEVMRLVKAMGEP